MSTVTAARPARKPATKDRKVSLVLPLNDAGQNGVMRITEKRGRKVLVDEYLLYKIPADFGTAFLVEKRDYAVGEEHRYHVNLDGEHGTCECKGFLQWNHCRHVESLRALTAAGRL
jgi:hypothetical protein